MSVDNDEAAADSKIEDKYSKPIPSSDSKAVDAAEDKRDSATIQRESFLNIYKEGDEDDLDDGKEPDLSNGIRFKRDEDDEEDNFKLRTQIDTTNGKKPLIQELDAKESAEISQKKKAMEEVEAKFEQEFSFDTAERTELKGAFIQQPDIVFYNIPAKGYDKENDVRFALSSDEFIIELRDKSQRGKHVIRRLCKTLTNSIDVSRSEIQLLVDFIVVKLCKQEATVHWNDFGYDIAGFTVP